MHCLVTYTTFSLTPLNTDALSLTPAYFWLQFKYKKQFQLRSSCNSIMLAVYKIIMTVVGTWQAVISIGSPYVWHLTVIILLFDIFVTKLSVITYFPSDSLNGLSGISQSSTFTPKLLFNT